MDVKVIGVIGAGPAGREIARAAILGGYQTILEDVSPERLAEGVRAIERLLAEWSTRRQITKQQREAALARLSTANRVDEVSRMADMLIETVPDEMEVKLEVFTIFDKFAKPDAILASNTSLSITEIASITFRTENCVGIRFFARSAGGNLLEVVRGQETSDQTVATCVEIGRRLGMEVMVLDESREISASDAAREGPAGMNLARHIEIVQGDLTEMGTDAIVNAANNDLQLGGGVAGAIRRKGGPAIQKECEAIGTIPVGGAAITSGGNLKARYVIHAASMELGGRTEALALQTSTAHSLRIAAQKGLKTIAFPAVGTGIAGFPLRDCAEIMLREAARHLAGPTSVEKISFVLFDEEALLAFKRAFDEMNRAGAAAC